MMKIPKTMEAAVVHEFGEPLVIDEIPVQRPKGGEVLVKVSACGVCHTDLHAADGDWPAKPNLPFVPGHEGVGTVVEVGEGVTHLSPGDRVGIPWLYKACAHCEYCVGGWETLCESQQNTGYSVNGSFADYVLAAADYVALIPEELSFVDAAPILCAGVTTYKGLVETEVRPGEWCAVVGIGGLGHLGVQYAKAMGMKVVAVDIAEDKLVLAEKVGADFVINADDAEIVAKVHQKTGGVHGVLVTAVATSVISTSLEMLRRGGTCVMVGLPVGAFQTPVFDVVLKRLTVRGSIVGNRNDLAESLRFAADGQVKAHSHCEPLTAINEVFTKMKKGEIEGRVLLKME